MLLQLNKKEVTSKMAVQNLTQFTATAQKGLKEFLRTEAGGTGKRTALSMGLLVGGAVMMQHLAAQPAEAVKNCLYAQDCPSTDECFPSNGDLNECAGAKPNALGQCPNVNWLDPEDCD